MNPHTRPDDSVRAALVGPGGHGRTIQIAVDEAGTFEILTLFDPNHQEADAAASRFTCIKAASFDSLIAHPGLEAVIITSPNHLHRQQVEAALKAGLHVFVEKPIANFVSDGLAIVRIAETCNRLVMVGHNMRYGTAVRKAKQWIEEGRLGEVVTAEIHFSADNTHRMPADAWRLRPDQCPLLPVMQLAIHGIDLIAYFVDPIAEVSSTARSLTTPKEVVDSVVSTFKTESGVLGTIVSNYCSPVRFEYHLAGTRGSIIGTPHRAHFYRAEDRDGLGQGPIFDTVDASELPFQSYTDQMKAFADAVRHGHPVEVDAQTGLRALAVVEAMHESVKFGGAVLVEGH